MDAVSSMLKERGNIWVFISAHSLKSIIGEGIPMHYLQNTCNLHVMNAEQYLEVLEQHFLLSRKCFFNANQCQTTIIQH